jgi:rhodanese-related sulfurtransferase
MQQHHKAAHHQHLLFLCPNGAYPAFAAVLLQMCADGGVLSDSALKQLEAAAYTDAVRLEGGYAGWGEVSSISGSQGKSEH